MAVLEYRELKIRVERNPLGGYRSYAAGPTGEAAGAFDLAVDPDLMESVYELGRRVRRAPADTLAQDFGAKLFDALFRDDIRDLYHESLSRTQTQGKGLRITLALTEVPELMQLPWEFLYHERDFLAISDWTPIVRYLDLPTAREPLAVRPPLRILAMVSSPSNAPPLDVERERTNLERALGALVDAGSVEIVWLEQATLAELQRTLRRDGPFHVFHFIGHGGFDEQAKDGVLLLEDERGRGRFVPGLNLGVTLANHTSLRVAVLNSCEGGREADDDPFAGVASSLVRSQIPAVLAMQFEITDRAAATFAGWLYESLADGYPVDAALSQARLAIFNEPNPLEWGTPVLLMRVPDGRIFDVTALPRPEPTADERERVPPDGEADDEEERELVPADGGSEPRRAKRLLAHLDARKKLVMGAGIVVLAAAAAGVFAWSGGGASGSWVVTPLPDANAPGRQEMRGATTRQGEVIAVGRNGGHASVWTYDGASWARRDLTSLSGVMKGVAARGDKVLAVGWRPGDRLDAGIWEQLPSGTWQEATCTGCSGLGSQRADAVTFRSDGTLVAVGRRTDSTDGKFDAAVWLSDDGSSWHPAGLGEAALGGQDSQVMNGLAEIKGRLVAVGRDVRGGAVWTSDDGEHWTQIRDPDLVDGGKFVEIAGVARVGSRLVAVGWRASQDHSSAAATWISFDGGSTWERGSAPDFAPRGQQLIDVTEVSRGPSEVMAVGFDHGSTEPVAAVWRSTSGQRWLRVRSSSFAIDSRATMSGLAVLGDGRILGVGQSGPKDAADAAVWESRVND
jgi:hypothetical protein